jgi:hypothetical protein
MNPKLITELFSRARAARSALGLLAAIVCVPSAIAGDTYVWGANPIPAIPEDPFTSWHQNGTWTNAWTCVSNGIHFVGSNGTVYIAGGAYGGPNDRNLRITKPVRLVTYAATANAAGIPASIGKQAVFSEAEKLDILKRYAPYINFCRNGDNEMELFWPSSVAWALYYRTNFPSNMRNGLERGLRDGNYCLETQFDIPDNPAPSDYNWPLFYGSVYATNLSELGLVSFWVEKHSNASEQTPVVDLVYWLYCPYNRGKTPHAMSMSYDHHVGDWEHITVRTFGGVAAVLYTHTHNFWTGVCDWNSCDKYSGTEYPVVYCAWGSHGFWSTSGDHTYYPSEWLPANWCHDYCNAPFEGRVTSDWVEAYDFTARHALSPNGWGPGGTTAWPRWLDTDYTSSGGSDWGMPWAGPIYHWGNKAHNIPAGCSGSTCTLSDGPVGPQESDALKNGNVLQ